MNDSTIGARIRAARESREMTAKELYAASGVPETTIYRIETGEVSNPKLSSILPLITALRCNADEILLNKKDVGLSGVLERQFKSISKWPAQDKYDLAKMLEKLITSSYIDSVLAQRNDLNTMDGFKGHLDDWKGDLREMLDNEKDAEDAQLGA